MCRLTLALALLFGCLGCPSSPVIHLEDGGTTTCGVLGSTCSGSCPDGLRCANGICVATRGDCGGFAGKTCPDATTSCLSFQGADYGTCASAEEKACLCMQAPASFSGCR